ncbi:MAG: PIN domain-containing protein, partial [Propionibacteriaceae bacterium]|nr:PIN domain-containing protein [Propionibacteriaceae bacterium]
MAPVVVYDANVLYPSTLRDVLIRVGIARLAQPHWSEKILDEAFENLAKNRPDLDTTRLARTRELMNKAIRSAIVVGHEKLIPQLDLPDPDDRHVLAAAVKADATQIVTRNLRDFPDEQLQRWGVNAVHPDAFLRSLAEEHPAEMLTIVKD